MISLPPLREDDFETIPGMLRVLQRCFQEVKRAIVELHDSEFVTFALMVPETLADVFPRAIAIKTKNPQAAYIGRIRNITTPTAVLSQPVSLYWDVSQDGYLRVLHVPNLTSNTTYEITIEVRA